MNKTIKSLIAQLNTRIKGFIAREKLLDNTPSNKKASFWTGVAAIAVVYITVFPMSSWFRRIFVGAGMIILIVHMKSRAFPKTKDKASSGQSEH